MWGSQIEKQKIPFARRKMESQITRKGQLFRKSTQAKYVANGYLQMIHLSNLGAVKSSIGLSPGVGLAVLKTMIRLKNLITKQIISEVKFDICSLKENQMAGFVMKTMDLI
jgi:hypothetical protein